MTDLGERLAQLAVPDSEAAMMAAARMIAADTAPATAGHRHRLRTWLGSIGLGLLIGFAFTQPGRAVTGDLGRLVGIGDKPTIVQHAGNEVDSVVIGTTTAPSGASVEIVAARLTGNGVCYFLDLPVAGDGFGPCSTNEALTDLEATGASRGFITPAPPGFAAAPPLVVYGLVDPTATAVSVSYLDGSGVRHELPVDFAPLTPALADSIGAEDRAAAYYATLPEDFLDYQDHPVGADLARERLAGVKVTSIGADGEPLAAVDFGPVSSQILFLQHSLPPVVAGGEPPVAPPPPPPGAPATTADVLSVMDRNEVLASHASASHADDRLPPVGPTLVIGHGDTPGGDPYELVAFAGRAEGEERTGVGGVSIATCANLDYPRLHESAEFDGVCWGDEKLATLHPSGASERSELGDESDLVVSGETTDNVADVAVTYVDSSGERLTATGSYGVVDHEVAKTIGTQWTGGHFVSFMPAGDYPKGQSPRLSPVLASVVVTAFDADGKVLDIETYGGPG